jgi:zinc protease
MKKTMIFWMLLFSLLSAQQLPIEKSLLRGILPNGLHYTIVHNAKPKAKAELRLLVKAGSLEEEADQRGIAHFVEHMAFNGTKHFPKNDLIHYLESIGTSFGSDLNANTGFERTLYKLSIPLEGDHLQKALLIMRDWADGITFDAKEFEKERGVILEEARLHDNVGKKVSKAYQGLFYRHSKFMHQDPMGEVAQIKALRVERAKDFYHQWYRPELMHLIVVGDLNTSKVEKMIHEQFGSLINHIHTPLTSREIPEDNSTRITCFTDPEITRNSLQISYIEQIDPLQTIQDKRESLIESIISALINEKAKEQLRKSNPKAQRLGLSSTLLSSKRGDYLFYATYKEGDALPALEELYTLLYGFEKYGFDPQAYNAVITQIQSTNDQAYQRLSDLRSPAIAAKLLSTIQGDSIYVDYHYDHNMTQSLLSQITLSEVNQYFQGLLRIPDRALFFVGTEEGCYTDTQITTIIEHAKSQAKRPDSVDSSFQTLLTTQPTSTQIVNSSHDDLTDITHYRLANGITVDFKPTDFSKNSVLLQGFSWGGYSLITDSNLSQIQKAASWVEQSAPGIFTPAQLRLLLAGKRISLRSSIGRFGEGFDGSANTADIETLFQLLHLKITQAKIDPLIANNAKEMLKTTIEKSSRDPKYRFNKELMQFYFQHHPRVQFDTVESIKALDETEMLSLYQDRFSDLNNFHFTIIGDINSSQIKSLITRYLGDLPINDRNESFIDRHYDYLKGYQQFIRYYSHDNIATVSLLYRSRLTYTTRHAMALVMMHDILNIRLRNLIREEKSGVYGISAQGRISRELKNRAVSTIHFSCDPKRRLELMDAIKQQITLLKQKGVTAEEIASIQQKYLVSYKTNLKSNRYWLTKMMNSYKFHEPMQNILTVPERIQSITAAEIQEVARIIYGNDLLESVLLPAENNNTKVSP